jgi:hypothetical protein
MEGTPVGDPMEVAAVSEAGRGGGRGGSASGQEGHGRGESCKDRGIIDRI